MTQEIFNRMCCDMPHLSPKVTSIKYRLEEYTWFDDKPSLFNIIKRTNYLKSNGKTCYVDTIEKQIEIDRKFVTKPKGFTYFWVVRHQFRDEILKEHGFNQ